MQCLLQALEGADLLQESGSLLLDIVLHVLLLLRLELHVLNLELKRLQLRLLRLDVGGDVAEFRVISLHFDLDVVELLHVRLDVFRQPNHLLLYRLNFTLDAIMRLRLLTNVASLHLLLDVSLEGRDLVVHVGHERLVLGLLLLVEVDVLLDGTANLVMLLGECHAVFFPLG